MSVDKVLSYRIKRRHVCGGGVPSAVVAIPARNEAAHLSQCLQALGARTGAVGVVLFLNNCTDRSFDVARATAEALPLAVRIYDVDLAQGFSNAGGARRAAMELAAEWLTDAGQREGLLLTTDADSRPPPEWLTANRAAIAKGVDAVAGRIELDLEDARLLPETLHARGRLEAEYEALVTEMLARLDPLPYDPWPRHAAEPGASLAVTLRAYRAVGGMPPLALGEDRALVAALQRSGFRVRHDPAVWVTTSGRTLGRAQGGVADTLRLRCDQPDAPCDSYLEPAKNAFFRGLWRGKLRALHAGRLTSLFCGDWTSAVGLKDIGQASWASFAAFWHDIETRSPASAAKRFDQISCQHKFAKHKACCRSFNARSRQVCRRGKPR